MRRSKIQHGPTKVLALIATKMIFKNCNLLIRHPIILYLFLPFFTLKFMIFLVFVLTRMNRGQTKYSINSTNITCDCIFVTFDSSFIVSHS